MLAYERSGYQTTVYSEDAPVNTPFVLGRRLVEEELENSNWEPPSR
jgi:hypothetical protein